MDLAPSAHADAVTQTSPLFTLAREIDARLRERSTLRKRTFAQDAFDLLECKRLELFRLLGYSSITAYARSVNGFGSSKTSALIKTAQACRQLPKIKKAFLAGQLDWCVAEQIVKRATPANEEQWLEKARILSVAELKALVREEAPVYWRKLGFSAEELAWVEAAAEGIRKEQGPFALAKALAEVCRRSLEGSSARAPGGPSYRVVVNRCAECKAATRLTSEGQVPVSPGDVEQILCDAEVLDIRNGPARVTRTAPPKIRNYVFGRDQGRCLVPGCRNRSVQFHHEDGWQAGHDPSRCFALCGSHHRARHDGFLKTRGKLPDLHFFLADETYLGQAGDERQVVDVSAHAESAVGPLQAADVSARAEGSPPNSAPPLARPVEDATRALVALQLGRSEAERAIQRILQRDPGRCWAAAELVGAVLREQGPPAGSRASA